MGLTTLTSTPTLTLTLTVTRWVIAEGIRTQREPTRCAQGQG